VLLAGGGVFPLAAPVAPLARAVLSSRSFSILLAAELMAAVLLLTPQFAWAGALLALGVISGALVSHLTVLGIVVRDDGGLLFGLAIAVFVTSAIIAFLHRRQIPAFSQLFKPQPA